MTVAIELSRSKQLRTERDRFVAFAFAAADLLLEVDATNTICFASGATHSLTQHSADELVGCSFLDLLAPAERPMAKILLQSLAKGGRLSPIAVQLSNGSSVAVLGGCRLPTQRDFYYLTFSVPLPSMVMDEQDTVRDRETGLHDKDSFTKIATERLGGANPAKLTLLTLAGLETLRARIDGEVSSGLLAAVGRHLRARSAGGDSAGRLADGRFGVLHEGGLDTEALSRQIGNLAASADPAGQGLDVETSTLDLARDGISEADAARVLVYAINNFAESKSGEFTIPSLVDGVKQILRDTAARLRSLREELAARRFELVFQPIVSLDSRKTQHYEALVRFGEGGSPAARIAFAEQVGMIAELDLAVCERAMRMLDEHKSTQPNLAIAVNLSGRSLESSIFRAQIDGLLKLRPYLKGRLLFEVTESAIISNTHEVAAYLQDLRRRGFRVCLDDFGSGAVSFDYLNAFAVDFVKIDGKYVRHLASGPRDLALLEAMAELTQKLGAATIAEMVETEAQCAALRAAGIGFGQGYLFGKPGPLPDLAAKVVPHLALKRRGGYSTWN